MWQDLLDQARLVAQRAWSPYSGFQVGAALVTESGQLYVGCNVENASYGLTQCAERTAICTAVAAEGSVMKIAKLAVVALGAEFPPCGACRQVIAEFATGDTEIAFWEKGHLKCVSLSELLPGAFQLTL